MTLQDLLEPAAQTAGVLGTLIVSRDDGLVVAGQLQRPVKGPAVAALAAALAAKAAAVAEALGEPEPSILELAGSEGALFAAPARSGLLLVTVAARGADTAEIRRELLRLADRVG